ncbi:MAG TPA: SpoIVB peptidase S55 domain-containing protein [Drouetiella sp.]
MLLQKSSTLRLKFAHLFASTLLLSNSLSLRALADSELDAAPPALEEHHKYSSVEKSTVQRYLKQNEYMPVSEIKPGMEGYGLSVFQGTKIERFNVKVIGVIKKVLNNRDAILVRMSGGGIGKSNVIKGMSGSPVYINGKLIGAISYGFDFSTEPIAGITPIVDMLDALAQDTTQATAVPDRISKLDLPTVAPSAMQTAGGTAPTSVAGAAPHMIPLMSPVALSGFSTRAEKFLTEKFGEVGLYCSSGASGAMDESLAKNIKPQTNPFAPGSAISVMLTTGDFNTAGMGTTTASFGNKVLAFGHPSYRLDL